MKACIECTVYDGATEPVEGCEECEEIMRIYKDEKTWDDPYDRWVNQQMDEEIY